MMLLQQKTTWALYTRISQIPCLPSVKSAQAVFPNISIESCGLYVFLFRRCKKEQVTCGQSMFPSRRQPREHVRPETQRAKLTAKGQSCDQTLLGLHVQPAKTAG